MTSSQWLDLAVLAVAFVAAISGWRSGALGSLLSFVGVVLGAVAGVLLAPHVVDHIDGPRTKLFVTLFLILALVVIGEIAGVVLGRAVRGAIRNRTLRTFDSVIGVGLQLVAVLVAAWLLATPLTSSDQPNLAAAVRGSKVLAQVDEVAPSWLKSVPTRLSALLDTSGLPDVLQPFGRTPDRRGRGTRRRAGRRRRRRRDPPERGEDPRCRPELPESVGGQRFCRRAESGDVQRARGRGLRKRDGRGRRPNLRRRRGVLRPRRRHLDPRRAESAVGAAGIRRCARAETGTDAVVMGYPGGGDFVATPARVREIIELKGPDIYRTTTVTREVYTDQRHCATRKFGRPDDRP